MRFRLPTVLAPVLAALAACSGGNSSSSSSSSSSSGAPGCTPGIQQACACPGGGQGAQVCNAAGTGFDACLGCGSSGSSSSASGPNPSSSSAPSSSAAGSSVMASSSSSPAPSSSAAASSAAATSLAPASSSATSGPTPVCTAPTAVSCTDETTLQLNLRTEVNTGLVGNSLAGGTWTSTVDASAGGALNPAPPSYVYARFTDTGLTPVAITDADAFTRMDWDIALRRSTLRLNSAASGPSCVAAAQLPPTTTFDAVTEAPASPAWVPDAFMTPQCGLIVDSSGLPTPPATALAPYYRYAACVQMTGAVFVVRLADGRVLKLTVDQYYNDAAHAECQGQGAITTQPNGAGNHRLRWAFLATP